MASSTAATATDALWGSTPIRTFMSAHLRFGRTSLPSARAKDIPTSGPAPIPLLSHSARRGHTAGRKPRTSQPIFMGDRKFASDPCITGTLEA